MRGPTAVAGLAAGFLAALVRLVTGIQVRWRGCSPSPRQRIYFANHSSHLDFVAIWAALPPEVRTLTRPVAARDYWEKGPIRRWLASDVFRAVLVDRGGRAGTDRTAAVEAARRTVERTVEALGRDGSLVLFPEGTRGTGEEIAPFKAGLYHVADARPKAELVPCRLVNLNRILPKGEVVPVPFMSFLTIGEPMFLEPGESRADFLARARAAVLGLGAP